MNIDVSILQKNKFQFSSLIKTLEGEIGISISALKNSFSINYNGIPIVIVDEMNSSYNSYKCYYNEFDNTTDRIFLSVDCYKYFLPEIRKITFEYTEKNGIILMVKDLSLIKQSHSIEVLDGTQKIIKGFNTTDVRYSGENYIILTDKYRENLYEIHISPEIIHEIKHKINE